MVGEGRLGEEERGELWYGCMVLRKNKISNKYIFTYIVNYKLIFIYWSDRKGNTGESITFSCCF